MSHCPLFSPLLCQLSPNVGMGCFIQPIHCSLPHSIAPTHTRALCLPSLVILAPPPLTPPQAAAEAVGKKVAELAKAAGVSKVAFDRGGFTYHGRIQALADAAREAGLDF